MKILVTGAGPTGLAASLFLARHGHTVRIIERRTDPAPFSKAFGVNPRTLELLARVGVADRFVANGRKMPAVNLWVRDRPVLRIRLGDVAHTHPYMLVQSQADSERLLADAAMEGGLRVERGLALDGLEVLQDGVRYTLSDGSAAEADYVLGADGSRSVVRQRCGIPFEGADAQEPWELYDVELTACPVERDEAHVFMLEGGAMFLVRIAGDTWRVLGNLPGLLDRLPRGSRAGAVRWRSDFGIEQKVAASFGHQGRVFLAGDAAHIHAGLGARGMNLGIEDAWVFATMLHKGCVADYPGVRRPVVLPIMARIEHMTDVMRGQSLLARAARSLVPLLGPILAPLVLPSARSFVLGLDHDVGGA